MKISLQWLTDFVELPTTLGPSELAHELTLKTVEVESITSVDGDVVLEIDNKSLTNRPDLWCHYGIARELAAIYDLPLAPAFANQPQFPPGNHLVAAVDPTLCHRFVAVELAANGDVHTPRIVRDRLVRIGQASVNPWLDLSNYVMFATGQPSHVYDADRIAAPLSAEFAELTTPLELIAADTITPGVGEHLPVIRAGHEVLGVAGIMGGASAAVTSATRRVLWEAASFVPQPIRRAAGVLNLRTESSMRFEKGIDTSRIDVAFGLFSQLLPTISPQVTVAGIHDLTQRSTERASIEVDRRLMDHMIGHRFDDREIRQILQKLGYTIDVDGTRIRAVAPTWRSTGDVALPQDVVRDVARIHGYDDLPITRPSITLRSVRSLQHQTKERTLRETLAFRAGLREVLTYPWVSNRLLATISWDENNVVRLAGENSTDRNGLRPSLIPNLLDSVRANLRHYPSFGIFEIGQVFALPAEPSDSGEEVTLPLSATELAVMLVGDDGVKLFREAKGIVDLLRRHAQLADLSLGGDTQETWADQSARIGIWAAGKRIGSLALVTPQVRRIAGIDTSQVACIAIRVDSLTSSGARNNAYAPLSDLPGAEFDLSIVVADHVKWSAVAATIRQAHDLVSSVSYVDEYRGSWVPAEHRSLTVRIHAQPTDATLTTDRIKMVRDIVLGALADKLNAHLRT